MVIEHQSKKLGNRVMVIAETEQQRQAFSDTIAILGLQLVDCVEPQVIKQRRQEFMTIEADIWLVDSQYDEELYHILDSINNTLMLVGFEQAPALDKINLYAKWQRKLKRKMSTMIKLPQTNKNSAGYKKFKPWQYVVVLAASQQDTDSVKAFLDNLPSTLPIAILLVQDVLENEAHSLPQRITADNHWQSEVISVSLNMQAGFCYVVPPKQKVVYDSTGRAIVTSEMWWDERSKLKQANLGHIIENCSDAFGEQLITILFANKLINGTLNSDKLRENNSQSWSQINPQKQNINGDYYHDKISQLSGTPSELAAHLMNYID